MITYIKELIMATKKPPPSAKPPAEKDTKKIEVMIEKELINYCSAKVIEYFRLVSVDGEGREAFQVWVKGTWSETEHLLITHNTRKPRLWSSLDRATRHFKEKYHYKGRVYLEI